MENKNAKTEYEVVFVVYGNVSSEDVDIGDIEVSPWKRRMKKEKNFWNRQM